MGWEGDDFAPPGDEPTDEVAEGPESEPRFH